MAGWSSEQNTAQAVHRACRKKDKGQPNARTQLRRRQSSDKLSSGRTQRGEHSSRGGGPLTSNVFRQDTVQAGQSSDKDTVQAGCSTGRTLLRPGYSATGHSAGRTKLRPGRSSGRMHAAQAGHCLSTIYQLMQLWVVG
jgi:hypothetical protein